MRLDFEEEPKRADLVQRHRVFHRMINTSLLGFGIGICELAAGNKAAAGVAIGVGIIASGAAGVITNRQEVRQNNDITEASNQ